MMRLETKGKIIQVTMPKLDLMMLTLVPEFRDLVTKFPTWFKFQVADNPSFLYLNPMIVPFLLSTKDASFGLHRLRITLKTHTAGRV